MSGEDQTNTAPKPESITQRRGKYLRQAFTASERLRRALLDVVGSAVPGDEASALLRYVYARQEQSLQALAAAAGCPRDTPVDEVCQWAAVRVRELESQLAEWKAMAGEAQERAGVTDRARRLLVDAVDEMGGER